MMTRSFLRGMSVVALVLVALSARGASQTNPNLIAGLAWRNIGPFRGGRVSAVSGAVGQPGVFYIGLPLGGVWKTTSAGETWYPVMDSVKEASSVGAVAVAPSDPNIIYAGMGDLITGGGINEGNGVYKSTDAGKTWQHMGLDATRQIPRILVDPKDPNIVLVAAQGNIHEQTEDRGVFRSTDGGRTWTKTLYVDNQTGAQELSRSFDQPNVVFAATVRHYNAPQPVPPVGGTTTPAAQAGGGRGRGGAAAGGFNGTALFKSVDGGATWSPLFGTEAGKSTGLPTLTGRTSVAVGKGAQRVFIIGAFGLYRSDDGGASWKQATTDRRIANGQGNYNCGVYIDPANSDVVYTIATSSYRSTDGGVTFTGFKGAPGGDDPQQMWIDPGDGKRMILGVDQGATISLDAGLTWSSWYNQATAQVYHISVDNQYPYWVYATQQDSGSIGTSSRGNLGAITPLDWLPHPGYEFGSIVADPLNPKITYAGGESGIIKVTYPSGQWINVAPSIDTGETWRKVGNQPMAFSAANQHELLLGYQYLMSTTDGGAHWKKLSPDLGYPKGVTPPAPNPAGAAPGGGRGGGGPQGGSIESFSSSSKQPGVIWVGTNNGLIKLTKDHGITWEDVTIPNLPNPTRADISTIDASHTDPAAAYVAIDRHGTGDYKPYLYRTHDFGKTWTPITNGLRDDQPSGSFARCIRADTQKAGLLFAGTESSMYVSFDDGDHWQSLMLNLPNTSYRDIQIHENDLVVGTYGRGFWVLDDYSPLRQMTPAIATEPAHLFAPGDAIRVRRNVNGDTPFPPEVPHASNPPLGAIIYYSLAAKPAGTITLDISDASGRVVRRLSSAPLPPPLEGPPNVPDFWLQIPKPMSTDIGTNRINWNIRYENPQASSHNINSVMGALAGDTPPAPEGPLALPGLYTLKLTVDGKSYTRTLTVKNDPRSPASALDLRAQHDLQMKLFDGAQTAWNGLTQAAAMRAAVADVAKASLPAEVASAMTAFDAKLSAAGGSTGNGRRGGGPAAAPGASAPPPSFSSVNGAMLRQLETLEYGDMAPTEPMLKVYGPVCNELKTAITNWAAINTRDLSTLNALLAKNNLAAIAPASSALTMPVCPAMPANTPATGRGRGGVSPAAR